MLCPAGESADGGVHVAVCARDPRAQPGRDPDNLWPTGGEAARPGTDRQRRPGQGGLAVEQWNCAQSSINYLARSAALFLICL